MAEFEFGSEPTITFEMTPSYPPDGQYLQPSTPLSNHMERKTSESSGLRISAKKKKRPSLLPWKNDHHEGEKPVKVKKPKSSDVSTKSQPGMPPPDSMVTITTATGIKGPLADSNPDLDDMEADKSGDKSYKKLMKQIAQLTKTVETLKREKESLVEEKNSLKSTNKTLEKEVKHLSSQFDSCKSELEHLKLQHSKDKRRPQQEHAAELEEKVRRLETLLAERQEEVVRLQKKTESQEKMLGEVKTGEEARQGGATGPSQEKGRPEFEEGFGQYSEKLREQQEVISRLRSELAELKAEYLAMEGEMEQVRSNAFAAEFKPQIKGTPVPRVRSQSLSQVTRDCTTHDSGPSPSPQHRRLSSPSSPTNEHQHESRRVPHGSPFLSPRHVVSHAVVVPSSPPITMKTRSPFSSQVDLSMLQNCLRLALEEKKVIEQKNEKLEEERLELQASLEVQQANSLAAERLAQVDKQLEEAQGKLRDVSAEKAELEGRLESLQVELAAVRSRSSQVEREMARAAAEREAELKAIVEQSAGLRKEIEELKLSISAKVTAEPQVTTPVGGSVEGTKTTALGSADVQKSLPFSTSEVSKKGTIECQTDLPASPLSPQSPQRSMANKTPDKQKVSNKFVNMRAVFETSKLPSEEAALTPTRRHSASLTKEKLASEDQVLEEERAATLPGVHKKERSPEPKGKSPVAAASVLQTIPPQATVPATPQTTPPQPTAPSSPQTIPSQAAAVPPIQGATVSPSHLQTTAVNQNVPLARTLSPSRGTISNKIVTPTHNPSASSPHTVSPIHTGSTQAQAIPSNSTTPAIPSVHGTTPPVTPQATPTTQPVGPSIQMMATPPQTHSAVSLQKTSMARTGSPYSPSASVTSSTQRVPSSVLPITLTTQAISSPLQQTTPSVQATPPQTTSPPHASPSSQTTVQSTRSTLPSQSSPSRTACQATLSSHTASPTVSAPSVPSLPTASSEVQLTAAAAAAGNATHDVKGVPLTRVLTPTVRQGEQSPSPKVTFPSRTESRDQLVSPSLLRTNTSPAIPIKTSTAVINVQKKEQSASSFSESAKPGTQVLSTSTPARPVSMYIQSSSDTVPPSNPLSVATPTFSHRSILKTEKFTVRASSPLYQQGTAELKQAPVVTGSNDVVQKDGDTPSKAPPTTATVVAQTLSSSMPVSSTSTTAPSSISISTTTSPFSVQLRNNHKKLPRPMTYCPQSSTYSSPGSSSANLSSLISQLQEKQQGAEEREEPSRVPAVTTPSHTPMRVASWTSNGVSAATPTSSNKIASIAENRQDMTQQTSMQPTATHQNGTQLTTNETKGGISPSSGGVNKTVGPPVVNKPAGPAVASGPAVAMGPTAVVEKSTVPTVLAEKPTQMSAAEKAPAKVQRSNTISAFDRNSKKALLLRWCQRMTQDYDNVDIANFAESFADGLAFCALLHHFMPDKIPYHSLNPNEQEKNFRLAFETAASVGIPALLDVDDMVLLPIPDWMSVMTYVSFIYNKFGKTSVQNSTE